MIVKKDRILGPLYCIAAAIIWGLSFVTQKTGAYIGTFTFNGIRTFIGGLALIPVLVIDHRRRNAALDEKDRQRFDFKGMFTSGGICGLVLFVASNLQQHAFSYDIAAGKVGFITALYMILVPVFGLALRKVPKINVWLGVAVGIVGLYFLCVEKGDFSVGSGERFALLCAICFACHILVIDHFCTKVNNIALSCGQFLVAGLLSIICMFIFEEPKIEEILACRYMILYAGIGSCSLAFTFQIFGQRYSEPSVAAVLMCLESVFSVIFGWLIIDDVLTKRALLGCAIMFAGVILTQLDFSGKPGRLPEKDNA